jgi:hypothetical protein
MTPAAPGTSRAELAIVLISLAVFWTAFLCLAAGLALWMTVPAATPAGGLLAAGFAGLLALPLLRLAAAIASAVDDRDWVTLAATLAVLAILLALTLRDAATHP